MEIKSDDFASINTTIGQVRNHGSDIRSTLEKYSDDEIHNIAWEVQAGVEALGVFGSRWTIEILAALYIAGERRFNELRHLLNGISSRTLSDKLRTCKEVGLIDRIVIEGPPIRVSYKLTEHGAHCGKLLSPLVAYMKIRNGAIIEEDV
jgi:DNA-binding HxlR family transcriptional regulator